MSIIGDLANESQIAEVSALVWGVGGSVGGGIGTFLIGMLSKYVGNVGSFQIIGVISIPSAILVFLIPYKGKKR